MITRTDLFEVVYDRVFRGQHVDTKRAADCELMWDKAWEAGRAQALEEAVAECSDIYAQLATQPARLGAVECGRRIRALIDKEPT